MYEHYKGGLYLAIKLTRHHETKALLVDYVQLSTGTGWSREWATPGAKSWTDFVPYRDRFGNLTGEMVPRYKFKWPMHYVR